MLNSKSEDLHTKREYHFASGFWNSTRPQSKPHGSLPTIPGAGPCNFPGAFSLGTES